MNLNILIVGVGGQGTLLASKVLGNYAELNNFDCKLSEVHGMAQRGGSVVTHVKIADSVCSPVIFEGSADVILSFEKLEAARYIHFLKKGGYIITNTQEIMPMPVVTGQTKYPEDLEKKLKKTGGKVVFVNALKMASELGNIKALNTIMLGVLCKNLNLDVQCFKKAIENTIPNKHLQLNIEAFEKGYAL